MIRMCCVCHKVEDAGEWRELNALTGDKRITHGYCPECFAATMDKIEDFIHSKAYGTLAVAGWSAFNGLGGSCV